MKQLLNKSGKVFLFGLIFAIKMPAYSFTNLSSLNFKFQYMPHSLQDTGSNESLLSVDKPVLISDQFSFTEGPAADKEGNVFFTDQPNNKIWKYDINGKLSLFMDNTRRSNGLFFDKNGNIISCADEQNQLVSIDTDKKKITVLANNFEGENFNGPNDVWVNSTNGNIYFTDPYYERNYWPANHSHLKNENVYILKKGEKTASVADSSLQKPNGIIGTPDGKWLFVADIGGNKTFKFEIDKNGKLVNKKLFVNQGSDGMTIDNKGNIYLTGKGVTIYNPKGEKIEHIDIPEDWTGNICFGGKNKNILFITASKSIYIVHMKVRGS